ncbi:MAG: transcription antitermination factor NusB [Deltaproteobacteria bacterium]
MSDPRPSSNSPGARALALDILASSARHGHSVEELLAATLKRHSQLPRPERSLLLELVQGVKRWEIRLDYLLSCLADLPLKKLHPLVLQLLRLGAYQILKLDRIPARAVLHEAGKLAKAKRLPRSHAGFVNAILRRLAAGEVPALPDPDSDPVLGLSVHHSHPAWLVARWLARYGPQTTAARLAANNRVPPLSVRINTLKTDPATLMARLVREGVEARRSRFSPAGLIFETIFAPPTELASYRAGLWLFQDEGAQLVSYLLPPSPGLRLAEIGAGRGGKTTHLAEAMHNSGMLVAVDHHPPAGRHACSGRRSRKTRGTPPVYHLHHRTRRKRDPNPTLPCQTSGISSGHRRQSAAARGPRFGPAPRLFPHFPGGT